MYTCMVSYCCCQCYIIILLNVYICMHTQIIMITGNNLYAQTTAGACHTMRYPECSASCFRYKETARSRAQESERERVRKRDRNSERENLSCICIYIYVYVHVYTHAHTHTHICIYMYMYMYMHMYMYLCM